MTTAELIKQHGGQRAAAKALGIPRSTLQSRLYQEQKDYTKLTPEKAYAVKTLGEILGGYGEGHKPLIKPENVGNYDPNRLRFANSERIKTQAHDKKRKTVLFLYDIHIPNQSDENIALALDYAQERHNVDTIVLGGDVMDCAGISRWKKDPYTTMPLHEEIERTVGWLDSLRRRFPKAEIVYLRGNHEDRLQNYLWTTAAEISKLKGLKLQDQIELDRLNIQWIDNLERVQRGEKVYSIGRLHILHGHELGVCPNINPARQYFLRTMDNTICGHVHKVDEHFATTISGKTMGSWVCGPLCDMHPGYRPINPWVAGFALAHFDTDGLFSVKLKKIIEGRVL